MDSAVIPFDAFSKTQRCSPPEAPIRIVGRYPSCVPPQSLFVQILDHCMAEAMKSLGSRLTMLTTHSYRTAIARKPVRQDGNRTLRWHGSRRLFFPVNQEKAESMRTFPSAFLPIWKQQTSPGQALAQHEDGQVPCGYRLSS